MRGRKPQPTAIRRAEGNPGKRALNRNEPTPPGTKPTLPLAPVAESIGLRQANERFDVTGALRAAIAVDVVRGGTRERFASATPPRC